MSGDVIDQSTLRERDALVSELDTQGLLIEQIRLIIKDRFGSKYMPIMSDVMRLRRARGVEISKRNPRTKNGPYDTVARGKARERARVSREKERTKRQKVSERETNNTSPLTGKKRAKPVSSTQIALNSSVSEHLYTDVPRKYLNLNLISAKITKEKRDSERVKKATISQCLMLLHDQLPSHIQDMLSYGEITCLIPGVIRLSKMGCIVRQVGGVYRRHTKNLVEGKVREVVATRFKTCAGYVMEHKEGQPSSPCPCRYWLSNDEYFMVIGKIRKYREDVASKIDTPDEERFSDETL